MAGEVKADQFNPPYRGRIEIMPRTCPVSQRFGEVCCRLDTHTGELTMCPFLYGLAVVVDARHHMEGRSIGEIRGLLASVELYSTHSYTALCLECPPAHTLPGIHPL